MMDAVNDEVTVLPKKVEICYTDNSGRLTCILHQLPSTDEEHILLANWTRYGRDEWGYNTLFIRHGFSEQPRNVFLIPTISSHCIIQVTHPQTRAIRLLYVYLRISKVQSQLDVDEYIQAPGAYEADEDDDAGYWLGLPQTGALRRWSLRDSFGEFNDARIAGLRQPRNLVFNSPGNSKRLLAVVDYNFNVHIASYYHGHFHALFVIPQVSHFEGSFAFDSKGHIFARHVDMNQILVWSTKGQQIVSKLAYMPSVCTAVEGRAGQLLSDPRTGHLFSCEQQSWPRTFVLYSSTLLLRRLLDEQAGEQKVYHRKAPQYQLKPKHEKFSMCLEDLPQKIGDNHPGKTWSGGQSADNTPPARKEVNLTI